MPDPETAAPPLVEFVLEPLSLVAALNARIDAWREETFFNTSVSRDTELWNAVHARLETLKADLVRLITET